MRLFSFRISAGLAPVLLGLLVSMLGRADPPPVPATGTNEVEIVYTEKELVRIAAGLPPYFPPPPKIAKFSKWEDGQIYDITESGFKIMVDQYKFVVEMNTNLVAAEWIKIDEIYDPSFDWSAFVSKHNNAFFRVRKAKQPHPPTDSWNRSTAGTNRPTGGFKRTSAE